MPDLQFEILYGRTENKIICGIDEVGRGPLAGPVMAAAAIFPEGDIPQEILAHLNDSKQLSEKQREALYPFLISHCLYGVAEASVAEIDQINILNATFLAMERALLSLEKKIQKSVDVALVDGNRAPKLPCTTKTIIKGDGKSLSIAAASVIAKVTRDRLMKELAKEFDGYGWERNAGYGTANHMQALRTLGATPWHRRSFAPVAEVLEKAV